MLSAGRSGEESAGRRNLRTQLVLERITGRPPAPGYVSAAMQQGTEREAEAVALYEATTGNILSAVGFCAAVDIQAGCSPDGVVGNFEGIAEIKSPLPATHLEYLRSGMVPSAYLKQVTHNMWITGALWCDWLSYNPDFPDALQIKIVRVMQTELAIEDYAKKAKAFLAEVDRDVEVLRTLSNLPATLQQAVTA